MLMQKNLHVFILYKWVSETCGGGPCATTSDSQLLQMARPSGVQRCKFIRRLKNKQKPAEPFLSELKSKLKCVGQLLILVLFGTGHWIKKIKDIQMWWLSPTAAHLQLLLPSLP